MMTPGPDAVTMEPMPTTVSDSAEVELAGFLDKFTPEIATSAKSILAAMRARLPGAVQLVYDNYNALAIGFGPSRRASEAVFSIAVYPRWVSLFFLQGASLADPAGLLKGSGNVVRHIVLAGAEDLDKPDVVDLMQRAMRPDRPDCRRGVGNSVRFGETASPASDWGIPSPNLRTAVKFQSGAIRR